MITIRSLEVLSIAVPLRFTFRHALAARSESESVVVRVADGEGRVGFGECAPRKYVTGETPATVREVLLRKLAPPFLGMPFASFDDIVAALVEGLPRLSRDEHAAHCALELALLDLAGRAFGRSAGSVVGSVVRAEVRYGGVVSADGSDAAREMADAMRRFGLGDVKVKVGRGSEADDLATLRAVRGTMGDDCSLRIDANGAWEPREALRRLESYEPLRLAAVEQPVGPDDLDGLSWLAARSPTPIVADESLVSLEDTETLAERRACQVFDVRASKCGGLLNSLRIIRLAAARDITWTLGAQVGETAILSAAGRHLGTRAAGALFLEGSYGTLLLEEDVCARDLTFGPGGRARALDGAGLGVDVDETRLARHVQERLVLGEQ